MSDTSSVEAGIRYVLVPVPSEYVLDVMRWVLFRAPQGGSDANLEQAGIRQMVAGVTATQRVLLELVANASLQGDTLRMIHVADELEIDHPRVSSMIAELNTMAFGGTRELIAVQNETAVGVFGNVGKLSYLSMRTEDAQMVRNALREVDSGAPTE